MLLAMFGTGGGPPDDVHDEHRVRFSLGSEDSTEVGQTAELCLVTSRLHAAESRLQELSRSPRTLEVLDEETAASTSPLDGHLPTESSPKLPKTRPKPLSVPAVAGPIRWAATPNGCLVEVAKDPKKYAERQAQKTEVRAKLDSHKIAPSWSSVGKALVLHGGRPLASKSHPSTVPASAYHKKKSIKIMQQSSTMQSAHSEGVHPSDSLVAHVRDGFKNWWFQPDAKEKHEWQDFMAEEVEALKSTVSTYGRTRSTIKGKKGAAPEMGPQASTSMRSSTSMKAAASMRSPYGRSKTGRKTVTAEPEVVDAQSSSRSQHSRKSLPSSPAKEVKMKELDKSEFRFLVNLSRKYNIRLDALLAARQTFRRLDRDSSGELSLEEFKDVVRAKCNLPEDQPIPGHLLLPHQRLDFDQSGSIGFEEFLMWNMSCEYTEEVMVADPVERELRKIARERNLLVLDVEKVKSTFDLFDSDSSGHIDQQEFRLLLCHLLGVRSEGDISEEKMNRYWREIDLYHSGAIPFDGFLTWYMKTFPGQLPDLSGL
jgi:Ca2+-binding EF-hand superfamily protein